MERYYLEKFAARINQDASVSPRIRARINHAINSITDTELHTMSKNEVKDRIKVLSAIAPPDDRAKSPMGLISMAFSAPEFAMTGLYNLLNKGDKSLMDVLNQTQRMFRGLEPNYIDPQLRETANWVLDPFIISSLVKRPTLKTLKILFKGKPKNLSSSYAKYYKKPASSELAQKEFAFTTESRSFKPYKRSHTFRRPGGIDASKEIDTYHVKVPTSSESAQKLFPFFEGITPSVKGASGKFKRPVKMPDAKSGHKGAEIRPEPDMPASQYSVSEAKDIAKQDLAYQTGYAGRKVEKKKSFKKGGKAFAHKAKDTVRGYVNAFTEATDVNDFNKTFPVWRGIVRKAYGDGTEATTTKTGEVTVKKSKKTFRQYKDANEFYDALVENLEHKAGKKLNVKKEQNK